MNSKSFFIVLITLILSAGYCYADAPLKEALGLNIDQARTVNEIQQEFRKPYRVKRGDFERKHRKLVRARKAYDSDLIAQQTAIVEKLREEVRQIRLAEDQKIRGVLTPKQLSRFEAYIEQRRAMVGSSRDAKIFNF